MKYYVVELREVEKRRIKTHYAITIDGKPIGLTLPRLCGSVEMAQEFLDSHPSMEWKHINSGGMCRLFSEFLRSREPDDDSPDADIKAGRVMKFASIDEMTDSLKRPFVATEEATGESEYHIKGIRWPEGNVGIIAIHKKSHSVVAKIFVAGDKEEPEGFLEWIILNGIAKPHELTLQWIEMKHAEYKAETAEQEPEFVCSECDSENVVKDQYPGTFYFYLECESCLARCGWYCSNEMPDASWIRKEPA